MTRQIMVYGSAVGHVRLPFLPAKLLLAANLVILGARRFVGESKMHPTGAIRANN